MAFIPSLNREHEGAPRRRSLIPYLWILPALLLYGVFKLYPLVNGLQLATLRWDGIDEPVYVGLTNFQRILQDQTMFLALRNNLLYAAGTVTGKIILSLFLALVLNQAIRGRLIYRTGLFLPVVMSFVVIGILWSWMYNPQFGLINNALKALGLGGQQWLGDTNLALPSLMVVDIWKWYGFHMVIFLAGLQSIPAELYESARIDGANRWQQFLNVTLPLLQPVMVINVLLSLAGALNVFDIPYVMTEGGPANSTLVMALHIYLRGFKFNKFGYSAALGYVLFAIVTVVVLIQLRLMKSDSADQ
jgi:raffinose/stachyose/melibiose transport system permease protein